MSSHDFARSHALMFGKLPSQPDFVRVNVNDKAGLALADWITRATDSLIGLGAQLPPWVGRFIYAPAPGEPVFIGAIAPSRDAVGRSFPICIATSVPMTTAVEGFAALPIAYAGFLEEATAILHEAPLLTLDEARQRVAGLGPPPRDSVLEAQRSCQLALAEESTATFSERLFGSDPGALNYALHTFACAVGPSRGNAVPRASVVLDCPIALDIDLLTWLAFAQRALNWRDGVATAYWLGAAQPRLLLSLGPPTSQFLQFVAGATHSSHLWPLHTTRPDARDAASAALAETLTPLGDLANVHLDALLTAISSRTYS